MKIVDKPSLPKEIFASESRPALLAQAVRVYLANQRQGTQSALTRADINRTRHKLYKQKGTGGARHGDRKAPIFVGGGIAFAPKPRDYSLSLPKQLKKRAVAAALTSQNKNLHVIAGIGQLSGKTRELAKFLGGLEGNASNLLIVTDIIRDNVYRASRNITGVTVLPANQLNAYEILRANQILMMEEAIPQITSVKAVKEVTKITVSTKRNPRKIKKVTKTKKTMKVVKKAKR